MCLSKETSKGEGKDEVREEANSWRDLAGLGEELGFLV